MKVLVVTNMYPTPQAPSLGIFVREHVTALEAQGVEVEVFFVDGRRRRSEYLRALPSLARRLRRGDFDIAHAQHTYSMLQVALARLPRGLGAPIVLTVHEGESFLPRGARDPDADFLKRLVYSKRIKRWAVARADHVVAVAPGLMEAISSSAPVTVIPPGVDVDRFLPLPREDCRTRLGLPLDQPVVFFPASPERDFNKGYSEFQEAVARLGQPVRTVVGGGIHPDEMPVYMNAADVVVQASRYEASPMVVKEALACERPLVSTDVGDVRALCDGLPGCFVTPLDPDGLAGSIRAALALDGLAPGGRARILERGLTVPAVARRYVDVYRETLEEGRSR